MEWSRSVQGEDHNWPEHIIATNDGGWLVAGYTMNALTTVRDLEAIKFNSGAQIEWVGIYTGADEDSLLLTFSLLFSLSLLLLTRPSLLSPPLLFLSLFLPHLFNLMALLL